MLTEIKNFQKRINKIRLKKKLVLCHGVFDLVHLGHIKHFKKAKSYGDYLIVSLTSNKYIKKGPGRPIFNQNQRLEFLKEIKIIDEVLISSSASAEDIIKLVKPDFYVKGPDYKNNIEDKTGKIKTEKKLVEKFGGKIKYTNDEVFSSSSIINSGNFLFNEDQKNFVNKIKKKFSYNQIYNLIQKFKNLKIMIVGEVIIDKYCFGETIGKSGKEPHLVLSQKDEEYYVGGSGAVARHISTFANKINLISPLGKEKIFKKILKNNLNKNIISNFIYPYSGYKTILKTRFVDRISNYKLFGSYVLPERASLKFEKDIKNIIKKNSKEVDMILVCDYGHKFISDDIAKNIKKTKKFVYVNAQINAANIGYHTINKYHGVNSIIINENELRQELRDNKTDIKSLAKKLIAQKKVKKLIVTQGKKGVLLVDNKFNFYKCPAFAKKSVDKVGAGDSMLAITSMGLKLNLDPELILFLGSIAAAISVENIGNKTNISFEKIDRILEYILK